MRDINLGHTQEIIYEFLRMSSIKHSYYDGFMQDTPDMKEH